jgi:hypothetical protein
MHDPYLERVIAAKEIAGQIIAACDSYARSPSSAAINRLLDKAERLADLAEGLEVEQRINVLDGKW